MKIETERLKIVVPHRSNTTFQFHLSDDTEFNLTYDGYGVKYGALKSSVGDFNILQRQMLVGIG